MEITRDKTDSKIIEIYPAKVTRRVLAFLADIFMNLILAIIFFELVVFQISRPIVNYDSLVNDSDTYQRGQYNLLYENGLLYFDDSEGEQNKFISSIALEDTSEYFLSFYTDDQNIDLANYDVFYKYFVVIKGKEKKEESLNMLNSLYIKYGEKYFDTSSYTVLGTYSLKNNYVEEFKHNFIEGDEMSDNAKEDYEAFNQDVFLSLYNVMFRDVEENNLYSLDGTRSYLDYEKQINEITATLNNNYIICAYISFLISSLILFLALPLISQKRETLSERILKLERVNKQTLSYIKKPFVLNVFLLKTMDSLIILFLIPCLHVGFSYLFSFPTLYLPSLIGLLISLIDLFITIFTKLNTSLKEITTDSIVVDSSSLDYYFREKGI